MLTLWAIGSAGGLWLFQTLRAQRRNAEGRCASCGAAWPHTEFTTPYLIHGRLTCEKCGINAKRRVLWHFGILTIATASGTTIAVLSASKAAMALLPFASTTGLVALAVWRMRAANRKAQQLIGAGEYGPLGELVAERNQPAGHISG